MARPTAAMIVIGDEILSGRTRDANMHHLAGVLTEAGIDLRQVRVVADVEVEIAAAVNALRSVYDHVFTSGGIGPTHDDITPDSVGMAFGVPVDIREDAMDALAKNYPNGREDLNAARLRMARVPEGSRLIDNPVSGAPGFSIENVHVMAGVPRIFNAMVAGLVPTLQGGDPLVSANVRVDLPEGEVAGPLGQIAGAYPDLSMGSYPFVTPSGFGANLVVRGSDGARVEAAAQELRSAFGLKE
ncbi:MAG: molybdopterin-binding protein [Pseudomonadota bacterium]